MTDKLNDDELRRIAIHGELRTYWVSAIVRELLTLRRREREARDLLKEAVFVFETYRHKRFVWLSEGAEHE